MVTPGTTESDPFDAVTNALKAGNVKEARRILQEVIAKDSGNVAAWELLYRVAFNDDERVFILNRILKLAPGHPQALQQLADLLPAPQGGSFSISETKPASPAASKAKARKKHRSPLLLLGIIVGILGLLCLVLWGVVIYRMGFLPFTSSADQTRTAIAASHADCQDLINRALTTSSDLCNQIGSNEACYGNNTVHALLVPGASQKFSGPGDIVSVNQIESISAAPLDPALHEWGIAIFKVIANLPRSLPGETVALVVFGNTTLENPGSLETFYFYSELGQVACDQIPFDGLMISMPEGTGIHFTINGSELTLMGNASLKAARNGSMEVSLYSGSGAIESDGQQQVFTAGEKVSIPLGGPDGTDSIGPPSTPQPLLPDELAIACTMTGAYCDLAKITPVSSANAAELLQTVNGPTITSSPTSTLIPSSTATASATATPSLTPSISVTTTRTKTSTRTFTPTRTRTRTPTPSPSNTVTFTKTPTSTKTDTPTATLTGTVTDTPTPTDTPTDAPTYTPTNTPSGPVACDSSEIYYDPPILFNTDELLVDINNNFGSAIKISKLHLEWQDAGPTRLDFIQLDGNNIWDTHGNIYDESPDSDFADSGSDFDWDSPIGHRTINAGSVKSLIFDFDPNDPLPDGSYFLRVTFDGLANCYIETSITK